MNRLEQYSLTLFNDICDLKDFPTIISTDNNKLDSIWFRNFKEGIKVSTSMIIKGLEPNSMASECYITNVSFEITLKQAKEMIEELQKVLDKRKK